MPQKWTGKVVGYMHVKGISFQELAEELGWTKSYISMILGSKRNPPEAETKIRQAISNIEKRRANG